MYMTTMIRKRRDISKKSVVVLLEGIKVGAGKTSMSPLWKAMEEAVYPDDEILVLTLLYVKPSLAVDNNRENSYIKFLHQIISQRKDAYLQIFRPFYETCKRNGVKLHVKIAAGFQPKDIIVEEATNVHATSIIIDRCFSRDLTFRLSGTECNVILVGDDEETIPQNGLWNDGPKGLLVMEDTQNPKSPKLRKGSILTEEPLDLPSSAFHPCPPADPLPSVTKEGEEAMPEQYEKVETITKVVRPTKETALYNTIAPRKVYEANAVLGLPLDLSWEVIVDMTCGFISRAFCGKMKNCMAYIGHLEHHNFVIVKRLIGDSISIFEAEKRAALSLSHRNILHLIGYHQSQHATILVFPLLREGTLDKYICGLRGRRSELTFQQRMKIAMGVAQGLRYMHEECPGGPVVHGDLQPSNILLRHDLQPLISGFAQATWLVHLVQASPIAIKKLWSEDDLVHETIELVKSDVFSFGVLLLRLFCAKSAPEEDGSLVKWARPLMLQRKFHKLIEEDSDKPDMIEIYRVMAAATKCTGTKPNTRPSMSQVICLLRGEDFCTMQSSPSDVSL
ncbi:protein NSP-INTERACTING KINASE 3-like isoform X2 [Carica papaya]|uniref:protein NSP-INTERACTING KINASE 3-like isoform X2 n=1 Tax=Carica papaya TaxID=3649 RepID=UPI000B8C7D28|nr:protein NSP-INTERACTING KINASE 3-like isoform X2 [Carica papaya]